MADLMVDTVLVHGSDDVNVPIGLARWLEQPGVVLDLVVRNVDTPTAVRKRSTGS